MTTQETGQFAAAQPEPLQDPKETPPEAHEGQMTTDQVGPKETKIVMEVVDMRIEFIQKRKHERTMERTLRWPIHSNTPRITF